MYNEEYKCISCGKSLTADQSVGRPQNGGCIPAMVYECLACAQETDALREALEYEEMHFCSRCKEKFKRPFFRNRKWIRVNHGCSYEMNSFCRPCYEMTKAAIPMAAIQEVEEEGASDLW